MAQDFGDDAGDVLVRALGRALRKALDDILSDLAKSWHQKKSEQDGMSKQEAEAQAEVMSSRPHACIPFGSADDAAYFAQVVRENGTYAEALTDRDGGGYVYFAKDDIEQVKQCVPQFSEVMAALKNEQIAEILDSREPVSEEAFNSLTPIKNLPALPKTNGIEPQSHDITLIPVAIRFNDVPDKVEIKTFSEQDTTALDIDSQVFFSGYTHSELADMAGKETGEDFIVESVGEPYQVKAKETQQKSPDADAPEHGRNDRADDMRNHTEGIRDKVLAAREQCRDLDDFEKILDKEDIGVTTTKDGEQMFYEARRGEDGALLPRGTDENGMQDWAVSAKTLANDKWGCDATLDWFEKNTPKEPGVPVREAVLSEPDLPLISNSVRSDLEERGVETRDRADGKMGFHVNADCEQAVIDAVQARFPGHTPEELGIVLDPHFNLDYKTMKPRETEVTDGSLDMDGSTPDVNQGIESHDGMDTMVSTLRVEREQNGTEVAPSMVREQSDRSREQYDLSSQAKECRAASRQLAQSNDSPDRDISDKFQQER